MVTDRRGLLLGIVTGDCAPVLFADAEAGVVGAAHAGWRGAVAGVIEATIAAMERAEPGSTFNVGGGTEVSMLEAIETLGRIAKRRLEVVRMPRREGDAPRTAADTSRIREALGWKPRTPFEEGLEAQWRWAADRVAAA